MYGFFWDEKRIYIILEYATGGDLYTRIHKQPLKRFDEGTVSNILKQMINATLYLHKWNVIHRDIKPENILLCEDLIKVGDFGWSAHSSRKRKTMCGTPDYLAPELVKSHEYHKEVDLWTLGILCYELCTGFPPFESSTNKRIYKKIKELKIAYPSYLSPTVIDFIK